MTYTHNLPPEPQFPADPPGAEPLGFGTEYAEAHARRTASCPEAEQRAAMSEDEYWHHVMTGLSPEPFDLEPDLDEVSLNSEPCTVCGELGACAYDAEGLPMIHASEDDS